MNRLALLQSMWAMQGLNRQSSEPSIASKVETILDAGFDGLSVLCADPLEVAETARAIAGQDLVIEAMYTARSADSLNLAIERAHCLGAHHLNIQADFRPRNFAEAATYLQQCLRLCEDAPFPVLFETHRDRVTNDLVMTLDLLDELPQLRLLADLSHYLVSREFAWPVTDADEALIQRILDRSWAMHGRVGSSQQIQVEISYPHHRPWLELFLSWWSYGFQSWRQRAPADGILCFTCEIGPQPYAISARDGADSVDRWEETLLLREAVRQCWAHGTGLKPGCC